MFEVKKGALLPPEQNKRGRRTPYPFSLMSVAVGDSDDDCFDAPDDMGNDKNGRSKRLVAIGGSARGWAKTHNLTAKFSTRKIGDVIRCWRIA